MQRKKGRTQEPEALRASEERKDMEGEHGRNAEEGAGRIKCRRRERHENVNGRKWRKYEGKNKFGYARRLEKSGRQ